MLKDDPWSNPALLDVDRGEALWTTKRGPKNVTLEQCDLGKGPGKVDGAFAELPRYFADADRVMDVETRILWCMEKLQGFDRAALVSGGVDYTLRAGSSFVSAARGLPAPNSDLISSARLHAAACSNSLLCTLLLPRRYKRSSPPVSN